MLSNSMSARGQKRGFVNVRPRLQGCVLACSLTCLLASGWCRLVAVSFRPSSMRIQIVFAANQALYRKFEILGARRESVLRPIRETHQVLVDESCRLAAFANSPDNERLAATHVSGGEDARNVGHLFRVRGDVAALVDNHAQLLEHSLLLRAKKAHREQDKIDVDCEFASRNFTHIAPFEFDANAVKLFNVAVTAGQLCGQDGVFATASFFMRR